MHVCVNRSSHETVLFSRRRPANPVSVPMFHPMERYKLCGYTSRDRDIPGASQLPQGELAAAVTTVNRNGTRKMKRSRRGATRRGLSHLWASKVLHKVGTIRHATFPCLYNLKNDRRIGSKPGPVPNDYQYSLKSPQRRHIMLPYRKS